MLIANRIDPEKHFWKRQDIEHMQCSLLACCLSKRVAELVEEFKQVGKLPDDWRERCQQYGDLSCERGELLIYPDWKTEKQRLEIEELFQGLSFAVACLAFVPGGVEIFGTRYIAKFDHGCSKA